MMSDALTAVALVLGVGVAAQIIATRLRIPSILLLLAGGWIVGPLLGWVDPDALLGDRLGLVVGIGVAVLLFEGGLSLDMKELRGQTRVVIRLVTIGMLLTWLVGAAIMMLVGLPSRLALLLGAILVVSGPTVVIPLLRHIRPTRRSEVILRWEGIVIDPIGALLAVVVFEAAMSGAGSGAAVTLVKAVVLGTIIGLAAAWLFVALEKRYLVDDELVPAFGFGLVVAAFAGAEAIAHESGFFAATAMGIAMANQRKVPVHHLLDFKESLATLFLGSLFVLLAARVQVSDLAVLDWRAAVLVAGLVLVARPLAVAAATIGTRTTFREAVFLSWMAPRGIVAAAVAAFFAIRMERMDLPGAELLVPYTFLVVVSTVVLYGLTARPLAHKLGVAQAEAEGILFVGSNPTTRALAKLLKSAGLRCVLIDTDREALRVARVDDLEAIHGNILDSRLREELDLSGIGRLWAMSPNIETNSLACVHFASDFHRVHVYQLAEHDEEGTPREEHLRGRILFASDATYRVLRSRISSDEWMVRRTKITEQYTAEDHYSQHPRSMPLFVLRSGSRGTTMRVFTVDHEPPVEPGNVLVSLSPVAAEGEPMPAPTDESE